jgi:hypothetical protein
VPGDFRLGERIPLSKEGMARATLAHFALDLVFGLSHTRSSPA